MAFGHLYTQMLPNTQSIHLPRPKQPRPIIVIGAGGIVRDAHLPAYAKAGFPVIGIMDAIVERAETLAAEKDIPRVLRSIAEVVRFAPSDAIDRKSVV